MLGRVMITALNWDELVQSSVGGRPGLCCGKRSAVCEDDHITLGRQTADVRSHPARARGSGESARRTGHQLAEDRRVVVKVPVSPAASVAWPSRTPGDTYNYDPENEVWLSLSGVCPNPNNLPPAF
jgi:hypothetical protein